MKTFDKQHVPTIEYTIDRPEPDARELVKEAFNRSPNITKFRDEGNRIVGITPQGLFDDGKVVVVEFLPVSGSAQTPLLIYATLRRPWSWEMLPYPRTRFNARRIQRRCERTSYRFLSVLESVVAEARTSPPPQAGPFGESRTVTD